MHIVTKEVQKTIQATRTDAGTRAGMLKVYEHTGKLKSIKDLRQLSEHEQHWFSLGFSEYIKDLDHPARSMHAPIHYGRVIYILSLIYYLSLITWLMSLIDQSVEFHRTISWASAIIWISLLSLINIAFTCFGIHLELVSYKKGLNSRQRTLAFFVIIVIVVGIVSNVFAPYIFDQHTAASGLFLSVNNLPEL